MAKKSTKEKQKRFSVTLNQGDYRKLKALADRNRPKLTVQYLVEFAVLRLLESNAGSELGNPVRKNLK